VFPDVSKSIKILLWAYSVRILNGSAELCLLLPKVKVLAPGGVEIKRQKLACGISPKHYGEKRFFWHL
jgi:hypothetical protein